MLDLYERWHVKSWRDKATAKCLEHIQADDSFTKGLSIGPVGRESELSEERVRQYFCLDLYGNQFVSAVACQWTTHRSFQRES